MLINKHQLEASIHSPGSEEEYPGNPATFSHQTKNLQRCFFG